MVNVRSKGAIFLHLRIQFAMKIGDVDIRDHISAKETFKLRISLSTASGRLSLPEVRVPSNGDRFVDFKKQYWKTFVMAH
jgi:hypothetical protein